MSTGQETRLATVRRRLTTAANAMRGSAARFGVEPVYCTMIGDPVTRERAEQMLLKRQKVRVQIAVGNIVKDERTVEP